MSPLWPDAILWCDLVGIGGGLDNEGDLEPDVESVPLDLGITGKRLPLFGGLGGSVVSLSVFVIKEGPHGCELNKNEYTLTFGHDIQVQGMPQLVCFSKISLVPW